MAARETQSAIEVVTRLDQNARVSQSVVELVTGLGLICNSPPAGTVGFGYTHTFLAGAGLPPYTFSISAGALPPGVLLNAATGVASGVPAGVGGYLFTVTVTDSIGTTASVNCSITIGAAPPPSTLRSVVGTGIPYSIPKPCPCDITGMVAIAVVQAREKQRNWPFVWCFPPRGAERVTVMGTIPVPAVATVTEGLAYTVDQGYQFALVGLVVEAFGSGAIFPGRFTWSLDLNTPVGTTTFQGNPIQGFTAVDVPLGSVVIPWPLERAEVFQPNDCIRSKFLNVTLPVGAPNYLKTMFLGWKWPA